MAKKIDDMLDDLMTYNQAADELQVARKTIWDWARRGILAPIKAGYAVFFRREDIEKLKREREQQD